MSREDQHREEPIDASIPHSARIWNYWLGGKDNYVVDREAGDQIVETFPEIVESARHDRHFLARAVRYLADEVGIRQFLDIGTGLPTVDNTHEIAQRVAPEARIVYVDNDPLVLAHAQALLTSTPEGVTDYVDADLNDPDRILREAARTLDFTQPIALTLLGIVHFILDDDKAVAVVRQLVDALPSGSHLVISVVTDEGIANPAGLRASVEHWNQYGTPKMTIRSPQQIARHFEGLEILEPGLVSCSQWRPENNPWGMPPAVAHFGGVGRKP